MEDQELALPNGKLEQVLECMLFVSPQPLSVKHVAESLHLEEIEVERAVEALRSGYAERGLQILRIAGGYQMCTRPEYAEYVSALLKPERTRLSRAALETVAIIAYRQPITQPEIDAIRGVNSDTVLNTLLERNLIGQVGRRETVGRPILYATTDEFLNHFGLNDLAELPELAEIALPESEHAGVLSEQAATSQTDSQPDSEADAAVGKDAVVE
jgi:segregation and condensation protein B